MRPSTLPTPSTRPSGGQRWPSRCRTVQADADDRQSPVSAPDAKLSALANWAGQIDACRFRIQVGDLVALRSEVWIRIPIALPKSEYIIRNPEPRLGRLVGQPSTARQTGRPSIQVRSAHRSGRARRLTAHGRGTPRSPTRVTGDTQVGWIADMPLGGRPSSRARGQGGRASNRAGYIR